VEEATLNEGSQPHLEEEELECKEEEKLKHNIGRKVVGTVFKGIGKAGDAFLSGVTAAMWETGKHAKVTHLRRNLPRVRHNMRKLYTELGQVVYEHVKQGQEDILQQESIVNIVDQLKNWEEHVVEVEAEIGMIKREAKREQEAKREKIEIEIEEDKEGINGLFDLAINGNDEQRYSAISTLIQEGNEKAIPVLVNALGDKNLRVRLGALRGLYKLHTDEAMYSILDALADEHPDVRASAVTYIGWSGNVASSDDIARLLKDGNEQVRKSAAAALGNLESQNAVESLIDILSDPDSGVQQQAIISLRRITHQFFQFRAYASEEERNQAIDLWRNWWTDYQERAATEEQPVTEEASEPVEEQKEIPPASEAEAPSEPDEEVILPENAEENQESGNQDIDEWKSWWAGYQRATEEEQPVNEEPPPSAPPPDQPEAQESEITVEQDQDNITTPPESEPAEPKD